MGVRFTRTGIVLALAALALPVGLANANAAVPSIVADWEMNDAAGTTVMLDSSGNGNDGAIEPTAAPMLLTGVAIDGSSGATGFRWSNVKPNLPPATPQRVVQVASAALNPGTRDWRISFRYRTSHPFGNIVQKGQSATKGGQIKFQMPKGQISCMFKGATGVRRSIKTVGIYDDNLFHVVVCTRLSTGVTLDVYDASGTTLVETRHINGSSGSISNTIPMTIGGKINCDQIVMTCDYFAGDIDWVKVEALS
jgi:hypothetical protein